MNTGSGSTKPSRGVLSKTPTSNIENNLLTPTATVKGASQVKKATEEELPTKRVLRSASNHGNGMTPSNQRQLRSQTTIANDGGKRAQKGAKNSQENEKEEEVLPATATVDEEEEGTGASSTSQ
jgi:hypothetical protein